MGDHGRLTFGTNGDQKISGVLLPPRISWTGSRFYPLCRPSRARRSQALGFQVLWRALIAAVFWDVQAVLLMLILLFTFARSEPPLAKSQTGAGRFEPWKNQQVQDVKVMTVNGAACVAVRLKAIEDPRMQRPEAPWRM